MRLTDKNFKKVGTIEIKSGSIVASDPCYDYGIWCAAEVKAKNGTYDIFISKSVEDEDWGEIVDSICIKLQGSEESDLKRLVGILGMLGVDAGVCGFYDRDYYVDTHKDDKNEDGEWYDREVIGHAGDWYHISRDDNKNSVGVWSRSGYGDGSYSLYGAQEDGEYYCLLFDFLGEDEHESYKEE